MGEAVRLRDPSALVEEEGIHPVEIPELSLAMYKEHPFDVEWLHFGSLSPLQNVDCDPLPNRLAWLVARMRTRASGPGR